MEAVNAVNAVNAAARWSGLYLGSLALSASTSVVIIPAMCRKANRLCHLMLLFRSFTCLSIGGGANKDKAAVEK